MSIKQLTTLGLEIADKFRLGHEATANKLLVEFIDAFNEKLVKGEITDNEKLLQFIDVMALAQQRDDNLFLADILQYEFLPLLTECLMLDTTPIEPPQTQPSAANQKVSSQEQCLTNKFNECYFYSANRNSFANKDSDTVFRRHFQNNLQRESYLYLISGTDSGLLIKHIDANFPKDSCFLFIELPQYIEHAKTIIAASKNHGKIKVCTIDDWSEQAQEMKINSYVYLRKFEFVKSLGAHDLFNKEYHFSNLRIESEFQEYIFRSSAALGSFEFSQQQLLNAAENIRPAENLAGSQKGRTCIILAGGPSLDDTIDWVMEHREQLLVISVSRISKRLISANITPDIVISVDPKHNSFEVSREMLLFSDVPLFAHTTNVNSGLLSQWQGRSVYIGDLLPWDSPLNDTSFEGEGPTVTNTAISLAVLMEVDSILLAGVDLCYSKQGKSHASGSIETDITGANLGFIGENAQTYANETVQTTIQMAIAARIINHQAQQAKELGINIYNLSQNAYKVEDIEYKSVHTIELNSPSQSFQKQLKTLYPEISVNDTKKHIESVIKEVSTLILDSEKIKSLASKALEHNESMFDANISLEAQHKHKIKMDKIEKQLDKKLKIASHFIKKYGIRYFIKCIQVQSADDWDDETIKQTGHIYYMAYLASTELVLKQLYDTRKRLKNRLLELTLNADIKPVIEQFTQDNQPGRSIIFRRYQEVLGRTFSDDELAMLTAQKENYDKLLHNKTSFSVNLAKADPLKGIRTKISLLFAQRDTDNLNQLVLGLEKLIDKNSDAEPLFYIANAYYLVLNEQYKQALIAFEHVGPDNLQEDELSQIASLALKLKMPELAESALSMLVNFNTSYLPKYAHLLKLIGKTQLAIDTYMDYLTTYKQDVSAWLALGELFMEIQANDSALMAFNQALSVQPDNNIAQHYITQLNQ